MWVYAIKQIIIINSIILTSIPSATNYFHYLSHSLVHSHDPWHNNTNPELTHSHSPLYIPHIFFLNCYDCHLNIKPHYTTTSDELSSQYQATLHQKTVTNCHLNIKLHNTTNSVQTPNHEFKIFKNNNSLSPYV